MTTAADTADPLQRFRVLTERLHSLQGDVSSMAQQRKAIIRQYRAMGLSWSEIGRLVNLHRTYVARLGSDD